MFGVKKVEAILESKSIIEKKNAPLGGAIIFANAEQSGSFMRTDLFYTFTFRIGEKKKEFRVTKEVYEKVCEGEEGVLTYQGDMFKSFFTNKSISYS